MTVMCTAPTMARMTSMPGTSHREWLKAVLDEIGITPTELARRAGINPSTLTRYLNTPRDGHELAAKTMRAVEGVVGRRFGQATAASTPVGRPLIQPEDAVPYRPDADFADDLSAAIAALCRNRNSATAWTLRSDDLFGIGLRPGDVLIVDFAEQAATGDVVFAQVYDFAGSSPRTIFRLYDRPYLLSASSSPDVRKPLVVDDERISIKGVVVASLRRRGFDRRFDA